MGVARRRRAPTALLGALALLGPGACGSGADDEPAEASVACELGSERHIGIAAADPSGVYPALARRLAELLPDATDGRLRADVHAGGPVVGNLERLEDDEDQVAFVPGDLLGAGDADADGVRALGRLHSDPVQVLVRKGAGIDAVTDLRDKRVSAGPEGSASAEVAERLLAAAGLGSDVELEHLGVAEAADDLRGGDLDALLVVGPAPRPEVENLLREHSDDTSLLDVSPLLGAMRGESTAYLGGTLPAGTYGLKAALPTVTVANLLVVREDADPDLACVLTKALFGFRDDLAAADPAGAGIRLQTARDTAPAELHVGARKALDDLGAPPAGTPATAAPASASPAASPSPGGSASASPAATSSPDGDDGDTDRD